ncbi:hypothetical protein SAMN04244576_06606, partial [Sinorhizobium meliloti]
MTNSSLLLSLICDSPAVGRLKHPCFTTGQRVQRGELGHVIGCLRCRTRLVPVHKRLFFRVL